MKGHARALFSLGAIVATPGALDALSVITERASQYIWRHVTGDWGDLDAEDKQANDAALRDGTRIFSAYCLPTGVKIYIITEADRSSTCLLLPEEY